MPVGQITPCTTIPEPGLESVCCNYRSGPAPYSAREATAMTSPHAIRKNSPHSPQLEEAGCSKEDPTEPKIIFFFFLIQRLLETLKATQSGTCYPSHHTPCHSAISSRPGLLKFPQSPHLPILRPLLELFSSARCTLPFPLHLVNSSSLRGLSKKSRLLPEASPDALNKVGAGVST